MSEFVSGIVGCVHFAYIKYKHYQVIGSSNNISCYNSKSFATLTNYEIKTYRVFKKCSPNVNTLFWMENNLDKIFYTSYCDEPATIDNIFRTCSILERSKTTDTFMERFVISQILGENTELVYKLKSNNYLLELEDWKFCTEDYFKINTVPIGAFFEVQCDSTKTPDICMKLPNCNIIMDVYNGTSSKTPTEKYNFYSQLRKFVPHLYVIIISTCPERSSYGQDLSYNVRYQGDWHKLPDAIKETFHLDGNTSRTISTHAVRYLNDLKYWMGCMKERKIVRTEPVQLSFEQQGKS